MNDQIDFYPEYTGTGLLVLLKPDPKVSKKIAHDRDSTYQYVSRQFSQKFNIKWLKPIGFNNSYALMMRQKQSKDLDVNSITTLQQYLDKN